jgi:hypothetical protein
MIEALLQPAVEMMVIEDVPARQMGVTEGDVLQTRGRQAGEAKQHQRPPRNAEGASPEAPGHGLAS